MGGIILMLILKQLVLGEAIEPASMFYTSGPANLLLISSLGDVNL
jgi:hypothetical protein